MNIRLSSFLFFLLVSICTSAQTLNQPKKCGWFPKDPSGITKLYENSLQFIEVKHGERIASVGAQGGNVELALSVHVDSIEWTLEDIDSNCLNPGFFNYARAYYEQLIQRPINSSFKLVLGTEDSTKLQRNYFDRVLLINTYHELTEKQKMLADIHSVLKANGRLVINDRIADKRGKKRHDCNHIMPVEEDLLKELSDSGFKLISSKHLPKSAGLTFYVFERL
jgi:SAM-dependent methyltransferase